MSGEKFLNFWERCIFGALCLAIFFLGVGGIESSMTGLRMSAWSISRTAFGFWIVLKLTLWIRTGGLNIRRPALIEFAPLVLFFAVVSISLLPNFRFDGDYRYLVFAVAHAVMVADVFAHGERQRWLLPTMAVAPVVLVLRGFADAPEIFNFNLTYRFDYPLDHANSAGYLLAMTIPLCLIVAVTESGWRRWLASFSCLAQMLALVLSYSRGAWMGWIAAMVLFGIAARQWKALLIVLLIAGTSVVMLPALRQRVASVIKPESDPSLSDRMRLARDAFELGLDHPILGVGYGRGRLKAALRSQYAGTASEGSPVWHTHNVYIELFAETGLLGLGSFIWLVLSTLWHVLRSAAVGPSPQRLVGFAIASSWTAAAVAGLGDVPFYHHTPRVFLFSLFVLAYFYCHQRAGLEWLPLRASQKVA